MELEKCDKLFEYFKVVGDELHRLSASKKRWTICKLDGSVSTVTLPYAPKKVYTISRIVYILEIGEIPEGYRVVRKNGQSLMPLNLVLSKIHSDDVVQVGSVWKTNYHGDVEILEYITSKKIIVKFLECGSIQTVQKSLLESGQITPNGNGRIKITCEEDFLRLFSQLETDFEIASGEYNGHTTRYKLSCKKCGHTKTVSPSQATKTTRCSKCSPKDISKSFKDFITSRGITDDEWEIKPHGVWTGVGSSKIDLVHKCGNIKTVNAGIGTLKLICSACSKTNTQMRGVQKLRDKHLAGLNKLVDDCNAEHNHEYVYDLTPLLANPTIYPYKSIPINYVHKPCGTVINKSLSYHLKGGPDGRGVGCPVCADYGYSFKNGSYLYLLLRDDGLFKIGITKNVDQRVQQANKKQPSKWKCFWSVKLEGDLRPLESEIVSYLNTIYKKPEGDFDGVTECFISDGSPPIFILKEFIKNF